MRFQLASRLMPVGFAVPFVEETRLLVCCGMTGATGNYYCGLHEFEEMGFLLHLLRATDTFADVGANVGSYTVLAAGVCGSRVYSFEPCLVTYRCLCDNIRLNDLAMRVRACNQAVGATVGTLRFTEAHDTMNHIVQDSEQTGTVDVPVVTLDSALETDIPCVVKVDVEGFETEVARGAERVLSSDRCRALIIEIWGGTCYGFDERALHQKLLGYGFAPCSYDPFAREITFGERDNMHNALYVKNREWAVDRVCGAPARRVNGIGI